MVTPPPILSMFRPNEYVLLNQNHLTRVRDLGSASDHEGYGDGPYLQGAVGELISSCGQTEICPHITAEPNRKSWMPWENFRWREFSKR